MDKLVAAKLYFHEGFGIHDLVVIKSILHHGSKSMI
jgi:hypothetical protein